MFLQREYVLVLYDKLIYVSFDENKVARTISFTDNIKQVSIFDDCVFACSDKRALLFTKRFGKRALCSVLSGSAIIGVAFDRLFLLRSSIDNKGRQSIKVS